MFQETIKPLLRPRQTEELKEDAKRLREILSAPPHIANRVEDRGQLTRNLRAAEKDLATQAPKPYVEAELDLATKRSDELRNEMLVGMPTQEEMRRNPPGAVDKHRLWEKRNKPRLSEWKNIQLRLHQSGFGELPDSTDLANFERYRPSGGSQQLNMDNAQITGATQFGPKPGAGPATVLSDGERDTLREMDPELAGQVALMTNEQRAKVKSFIQNMSEPGNIQQEPAKRKRAGGMSEENRRKSSERMKARWAAKKAAEQEG